MRFLLITSFPNPQRQHPHSLFNYSHSPSPLSTLLHSPKPYLKIPPLTLSGTPIDLILETQIQNSIFRKESVSDLKINDFTMMEKSGGCAVVKPKLTAKNQQQPHQEQLPCPRCHSTNTKFCYYNNYNFAQPRHLCKACRRYWTHGGTLRDIPMGGGSRKSAKRCRTSSYTSASSSTIVTTSSSSSSHEFLNSAPLFLPSSPAYGGVSSAGGFTSLLTGNHGPGVWALSGGFGVGVSSGLLDETGFGPGRNTWAFGDMGYGGINGSATVVGGNGGGTWQIETCGGVDCFGWPELAISTPGNGLK